MKTVKQASKLDASGIERAITQLNEVMKARGLRASTVRDSVARAALNLEGHFAADDLVRRVPHVGAATVYRVLPLLVEAGLLQTAPSRTADGTHYERAFQREHHDHLLCLECQAVVEFQFEAFEVLQRDVAARFGFSLTGHVHELHGLCEKCGRKKSKRR